MEDGQKTHAIYLKAQMFTFSSEALSMWNQTTSRNTDNSGTWNIIKKKKNTNNKTKVVAGGYLSRKFLKGQVI